MNIEILNIELQTRRNHLYAELGTKAIVILSAEQEYLSTTTLYRQESDFYYLTGCVEPNTIAVFIPGRKEGEFIIFNQAPDKTQETWTGKMLGQEGAIKKYGANQAFSSQEIDNLLPNLILGKTHLYCDFSTDPTFDIKILNWLNTAQKTATKKGFIAPDDISHIGKITHEMRLRKSPLEIDLIKKAVEIAKKGHTQAMKYCKPGMFEYELAAELSHLYLQHGGAFAFNPVVAGGKNACTLHYTENNARLQDGDLVLIDSGVNYQYYNSDLSRTFPVNKKFSPEQRLIYEAVLEAQLAVIQKVKPGIAWNELQETAEQVISEQLLELGILHGNLSDIITNKTFTKFFPHGVGHWIGIDCHDAGKYAPNGQWRILEPNMIFTVEPGIYIPPNTEGVHEKWWNIGVRIEDNILVTTTGHVVLSEELPKTVVDIENM